MAVMWFRKIYALPAMLLSFMAAGASGQVLPLSHSPVLRESTCSAKKTGHDDRTTINTFAWTKTSTGIVGPLSRNAYLFNSETTSTLTSAPLSDPSSNFDFGMG